MSPEDKRELLKNSLVKRVQGNEEWASQVENAIRDDLRRVVAGWLKATTTEGIGPKEAVAYLERINTFIGNEKIT